MIVGRVKVGVHKTSVPKPWMIVVSCLRYKACVCMRCTFINNRCCSLDKTATTPDMHCLDVRHDYSWFNSTFALRVSTGPTT